MKFINQKVNGIFPGDTRCFECNLPLSEVFIPTDEIYPPFASSALSAGYSAQTAFIRYLCHPERMKEAKSLYQGS